MSTDPDAIVAGIDALARAGGIADGIAVSGMRRVHGGNSSEIWAFSGAWHEAGRPVARELILRRGAANEFAFAGRGAEYAVIKALETSDVPAPRVFWLDADGRYLDRPAMIMERCPGTAERGLLTDRNGLALDRGTRVALAGEMVDILCRIHGAAPPAGQTADSTSGLLAEHDAAIRRLEPEAMVELRIVSRWLWRNLPQTARSTIVHGDYRPANMLVENGRISAILDWEFAHVGDPLEDLGWYLTPYYAADHLIPGAWGPDELIARYERNMGFEVDRAAVRFWAVFAMYKLAYMTVAALRWLVEGDASRLTTSAAFIIAPLLTEIARGDGQ